MNQIIDFTIERMLYFREFQPTIYWVLLTMIGIAIGAGLYLICLIAGIILAGEEVEDES